MQMEIKLIRGWGHMIGCKCKKELWEARKQLEEACVFHKEGLHNFVIQSHEVVHLD